MSLDWTHQYCFACDKQTDGATYCSESCRLADFERTSPMPSSGPSSPAYSSWTFSKPTATSRAKFHLSPAYDLTTSSSSRTGSTSSISGHALSPSNSHTSLCSMRSTSSAGLDAAQLSDQITKELRAYARAFEIVRLQRRRSY
ncbi:hypothetical protein B0T17DRAFT_481636 [Bombardia bombarda]|uniref:Uncharacterized protein n=1 Tax=Bombardia bombarda TaxID=252184 RepID=A0AA39XK82_9PEZI|nr:hypothetical protein B0T17DRAFT_481636 [Bombardia bombarda]